MLGPEPTAGASSEGPGLTAGARGTWGTCCPGGGRGPAVPPLRPQPLAVCSQGENCHTAFVEVRVREAAESLGVGRGVGGALQLCLLQSRPRGLSRPSSVRGDLCVPGGGRTAKDNPCFLKGHGWVSADTKAPGCASVVGKTSAACSPGSVVGKYICFTCSSINASQTVETIHSKTLKISY